MFAAPEEEVKRRLDICGTCPEMQMLPVVGEQCKICSCVMRIKARLQAMTCPVDKW